MATVTNDDAEIFTSTTNNMTTNNMAANNMATNKIAINNVAINNMTINNSKTASVSNDVKSSNAELLYQTRAPSDTINESASKHQRIFKNIIMNCRRLVIRKWSVS